MTPGWRPVWMVWEQQRRSRLWPGTCVRPQRPAARQRACTPRSVPFHLPPQLATAMHRLSLLPLPSSIAVAAASCCCRSASMPPLALPAAWKPHGPCRAPAHRRAQRHARWRAAVKMDANSGQTSGGGSSSGGGGGATHESSSFNNNLRKGFAPTRKQPSRQRSESSGRPPGGRRRRRACRVVHARTGRGEARAVRDVQASRTPRHLCIRDAAVLPSADVMLYPVRPFVRAVCACVQVHSSSPQRRSCWMTMGHWRAGARLIRRCRAHASIGAAAASYDCA
eukprot:354411-Chlamydomonas_euryale.AAC.12